MMKIKKILGVFLIVSLILSGVPVNSAIYSYASTMDNEKLCSATAPKYYNPNRREIESIRKNFTTVEEDSQADVLLIQDNLPWDSNANITILNSLKYSFDTVSVSQLENADLTAYKMIIIANDQTMGTYNDFKVFKDRIDLFCNYGGIVVYGACDEGWAEGTIDWNLPGGLNKRHMYTYNNYIVDYSNPIVTGELTNGKKLTDDDLYNNYCSHGYFVESSLPANTKVILRSSDNDAPTLIQYPMGSGWIIASTLTWEHAFEYEHGNYASVAMDDYYAYAMSLAKGITPTEKKMEIERDNNSFSHTSDNFFSSKELSRINGEKYYIDDDLFDKLLQFYKEETSWLSRAVNGNLLVQKRDSEWSGSCFGISATMALGFLNEYKFENFEKNVHNYYSYNLPKNNTKFRSLINYYQLALYIPSVGSKKVYANENITQELETIINLAKQSELSSVPFIFLFSWSYIDTKGKPKVAGHAIVCTGVKTNADGSYRLQFIDPNNVKNYVYANVPADKSTITFETIYLDKKFGGKYKDFELYLNDIGHLTLSSLKGIDIDGPDNILKSNNRNANFKKFSSVFLKANNVRTDKDDVFLFNSESNFILASGEKKLEFSNGKIMGNMEIIESKQIFSGGTIDYEIVIPHHTHYTIQSNNGNASFSLYDSNGNYYGLNGSGVQSVIIDMNSSMHIEGKDMTLSTYYGLNNSETELIKFEQPTSDEFSVIKQDQNILVKGDDLDDMTVSGFGDNHKQVTLPLYAENNELTLGYDEIDNIMDHIWNTGDVNKDGEINGDDVIALCAALATNDFTDELRDVADYNGDGIINNNDAIDLRNAVD